MHTHYYVLKGYMVKWWPYTATYTVEAQLRPYKLDNDRAVPSSFSKVCSHSWGPWNLIIPRPGIARAKLLFYKFYFIWVFQWRPNTETYTVAKTGTDVIKPVYPLGDYVICEWLLIEVVTILYVYVRNGQQRNQSVWCIMRQENFRVL